MRCTVMDIKVLVPNRTEAGDIVQHSTVIRTISAAIEQTGLWGLDYQILNSGNLDVTPKFQPPTLRDLP
jgi:hypothetical protein